MSTVATINMFEQYPVRHVMSTDIGEPIWIARDVCAVVGISKYRDAVAQLDPDERVSMAVDTPGGTQQMTGVTEAGVWSLMLISRSPVVKSFKRWLTHEVLPQIRRTGGYGVAAVQPLTPLEYARKLVDAEERVVAEHARADRAEKLAEVERKHRRAIEGGDGILLGDFGKKYFSDVRHTDFWNHLYEKKWLIDQRGARVRPDGEVRDGHDHKKPTYKGRPFIYEHDKGTHGGQRRFQPRVRPQKEIELRDALAAEGLPVNMHSTGLVLITNEDLKELGA